MKKAISVFIILLVCFSFISCAKNKSRHIVINLPQTQTPQELNQWGVTKYASLKLRESPLEEGEVKNHLPLGAIVEVVKRDKELKNFENMIDYWYYIDYKSETGWIFGSYVEIFNSYEEAEKRSEEVLFGTKK